MALHLSHLKTSPHFIERLWDLWCVASIIGIWPRFIEPRLLFTTEKTLAIPTLAAELSGLKLLHISDLHYSSYTSRNFLERILARIQQLQPDLIVFTGDCITYAELEDEALLKEFLTQLSLVAPLGTYAVLGNHDYSDYVSLGDDGTYRLIQEHVPPLLKGLYRLISAKKTSQDPEIQSAIQPHSKLVQLFQQAGIQLLNNNTIQVGRGSARINITGLGDVMALQCKPEEAFRTRDPHIPTIVLSHNPDSYDRLKYFPGELFLFGHTHGGQVNLPYIWKKITPLKNKSLKSGLHIIDNRFLSISRGLGASLPFRWFAPPEITLFTLIRGPYETIKVSQDLFEKAQNPEVVLGSTYSCR